MAAPKPDPIAPLDSPEQLESEARSPGGMLIGFLRRLVWTGVVVVLGLLGWLFFQPG